MPDFCCLRWRFRYALRFESCAKLLLRIELTSARAALGSAAAADNVKPALMSSRRSIGMLSSISTFSKQKTNGPAGSFNGGGRAKSEWSRIGGVDSTAAPIDTPPPRLSLMPLAPSLGTVLANTLSVCGTVRVGVNINGRVFDRGDRQLVIVS